MIEGGVEELVGFRSLVDHFLVPPRRAQRRTRVLLGVNPAHLGAATDK